MKMMRANTKKDDNDDGGYEERERKKKLGSDNWDKDEKCINYRNDKCNEATM